MSLHSFKRKKLFVGMAGSLKIELPLLEFGSGKPKVLILVGLHGDEYTGLFVISRLLERLDLQKGTLRIIPAANPLAQVLRRREEPLARKDPNRAFPGDKQEDCTERLTAALFDQTKECRHCVIDLHTLDMQSRLMTIFMNHGPRGIRETSLELIRAFAPDLIWQLDTRSTVGRLWGGSMGPEMAKKEIVNFAVEMANCGHATDEEINRAVEGIQRVLHHLGMILKAPVAPTRSPLTVAYHPVTADNTGMFEPSTELLNAVRLGDFPTVAQDQPIGKLINPLTFETTEIRSKHAGQLVAISRRAFVRTGDELYNVGEEAKPWTMLADATIDEMIAKYAGALRPEAVEHLKQMEETVKSLAGKKKADVSICRAALWLSALDEDGDVNRRLADSFLHALPDVDDETRNRVLECLNGKETDTPEAKVVQEIHRQANKSS